ncbi:MULTISPECIES: hypothetical protein [Bacteria]|uniref:hypothetical protein n=1 Tax=Bacteria TaxID=2 RepID=UPI00196B78FC|nr:hypothetical protein [Psychrobacter sp. H7-1]|tara:strand:+ start:1139 stop:1459 length:321 start_codon:yes stop_codon:yes gene_type:complete
MSLLGGNDLKEQQKINELELKINREKQKLDKKLTRQKILLGAFLIDMLEGSKLNGLKSYTVDNLEAFLTRKGDKELMAEVIEKLRDQERLSNNKTDNSYPNINNRS